MPRRAAVPDRTREGNPEETVLNAGSTSEDHTGHWILSERETREEAVNAGVNAYRRDERIVEVGANIIIVEGDREVVAGKSGINRVNLGFDHGRDALHAPEGMQEGSPAVRVALTSKVGVRVRVMALRCHPPQVTL